MSEKEDKSINGEEAESSLEEVLRLLFEMDKPARDAYIKEFILELDAALEEQEQEEAAGSRQSASSGGAD